MADGPRTPEKPRLTRRRAVRILGGLAGIGVVAAIVGPSLLSGEPSQSQTVQPVPPDEKEPLAGQLSDFQTILSREVNIDRSPQLAGMLDSLKSKSQAELANHLRFEEKIREDGEITRRYDFSFNGLDKDPFFQDIFVLTTTDSQGNIKELGVQFYVNEKGEIRPGWDDSLTSRGPFSVDELKTMARAVLKNPVENNQWIIGNMEEIGRQNNSIVFQRRSGQSQEEIFIDDTGAVHINYSLLDEP